MDEEMLDRELIYTDEKLVQGVKKSMKEARENKGRVFKDSSEMREYMESM